MSCSRLASFFLALAMCLQGTWLQAADPKAEFVKVRKEVQQQLGSQQSADRVAALQKLATVPVADSARLIIKSLEDGDAAVRLSAFETLLSLNDNQEVCQALLLNVRRAFQAKSDENLAPQLAVLITSKLPAIERETATLLEKTSGKSSEHVLIALADELGQSGLELNAGPLASLARTKAFRESFAVRRAVVDALARIPAAGAVGALISIMDRVQGEAGADALEYLQFVTEQIYGWEAAAWQTWWKMEGDSFEYPKLNRVIPYRDGSVSSQGEYYGLPIFAQKLVFVMDTSGSMNNQQRIMLAKRELAQAIENLPEYTTFNIVVFNTYVDAWQRQLVKATKQSKKAAIAYVESQVARHNTASYDALEAAFAFDTEAIYFMSDGDPNGGKIGAPVDIIAAITQANTSRRISLYTVGIAPGFAGSPLDVFLSTLAKQNYGVYRRVDE